MATKDESTNTDNVPDFIALLPPNVTEEQFRRSYDRFYQFFIKDHSVAFSMHLSTMAAIIWNDRKQKENAASDEVQIVKTEESTSKEEVKNETEGDVESVAQSEDVEMVSQLDENAQSVAASEEDVQIIEESENNVQNDAQSVDQNDEEDDEETNPVSKPSESSVRSESQM